MAKLIDFYRGKSPDCKSRMLSQMWSFSDQEMEYHHDFIQWMFPLTEPSAFNRDAPVLSPEDIRSFRLEGDLQENLRRSFDRFLTFLGLRRQGPSIEPGPGFAARQWRLSSPNHNWLRITRVLSCLTILGLEQDARAFFDCLERLDRSGQARITTETWTYWIRATFPTGQRETDGEPE